MVASPPCTAAASPAKVRSDAWESEARFRHGFTHLKAWRAPPMTGDRLTARPSPNPQGDIPRHQSRSVHAIRPQVGVPLIVVLTVATPTWSARSSGILTSSSTLATEVPGRSWHLDRGRDPSTQATFIRLPAALSATPPTSPTTTLLPRDLGVGGALGTERRSLRIRRSSPRPGCRHLAFQRVPHLAGIEDPVAARPGATSQRWRSPYRYSDVRVRQLRGPGVLPLLRAGAKSARRGLGVRSQPLRHWGGYG